VWGGRESLVSIACACANFSEIFSESDTSLRMSITINITTRVPPLGLDAKMSACVDGFDAAVSFSLGKLGLENIALEKEQRSAIKAIYKFLCVLLQAMAKVSATRPSPLSWTISSASLKC